MKQNTNNVAKKIIPKQINQVKPSTNTKGYLNKHTAENRRYTNY